MNRIKEKGKKRRKRIHGSVPLSLACLLGQA
jgi:hypothetical protein